MKISIITPVKNLEHFISETIESVINQKGDFDLEYLIMDGHSEDNTLKICEDYQRQIQSKSRAIFCNSVELKIFSKPDNSMYEALSFGLQMATGDIISYINADDFYLPNAFSCVVEIFSKFNTVSWISGLPISYNEQGHITSFYVPWQYNKDLILKGFNGKKLPFVQQESVFWRIHLNLNIDLKKIKTYALAGDYFLWHSFAVAKEQLFVVDSFLGGYRYRPGRLSAIRENYYKEFDSIKNRAELYDFFKSLVYWFIEKFAGKPIKRKFSKNRVSYIKGSWVLK